MPDVKELFDAVTEQVEPAGDAWGAQDRAQRRLRRNRRAGAFAVVAVLAAVAGVVAFRTAQDHAHPRPAQTPTPTRTTPAPTPSASPAPTPMSSLVPPPPLPPADVSFVDVHTGAATPLPRNVRSIENAGSFQVSPDGRMLAFTGGYSPARVYVANADGTHVRLLSRNDAYSESQPRWSPDSRRVVFAGGWGNGENHLFISTVASGITTQLTGTPPGELVSPSFTPDGEAILFSFSEEPGASDLWVIPVAGGEAHLLRKNAAQASYSPSGDTIAYRPLPADCRGCYGLVRPQDIVLVDGDGRHARGLASWGGRPLFLLVSEPAPSWSPDGSRIAVEAAVGPSGSDCEHRVFIIDVTTRAETDLGCGHAPSWFDDHTLIVEGYTP